MSAFMKQHKYIKMTLQILLALLVLMAIRAIVQRDLVSGMAPMISAQQLDGSPVSLEQFRGAPVLVHFWATWCGICRLEEQSINAIAQDHALVTVAMQSGDNEEIGAYLKEQGLNFPVISDPHGEIASSYGIKGVPASFILDAKGNIRFVEVGYSTEAGLRLRLWLASWM